MRCDFHTTRCEAIVDRKQPLHAERIAESRQRRLWALSENQEQARGHLIKLAIVLSIQAPTFDRQPFFRRPPLVQFVTFP